jgi:hypothetical protein
LNMVILSFPQKRQFKPMLSTVKTASSFSSQQLLIILFLPFQLFLIE